jgi:glycosyltransferase involved in cell wall biosynthesis
VATKTTRTANPTITIVVPALNEARNLERVLPELPQVHQVVLVDGGSVDDSLAVAKRVMPNIDIVQQTRKGKGNALVCGFAAATGDIIVMFDADGSADPAEIPAFVDALVKGADFAKGSRFCAGGGSEDISRYRSAGNRMLNIITNLLLGTRYTDLCYGYNAFWRSALTSLQLPNHVAPVGRENAVWGDGFEIETVLNCRVVAAGLAVAEVPSFERNRIFGESNLNAIRDGFRVLRTILAERRAARRGSVIELPVTASVTSDIRRIGPVAVSESAVGYHASLEQIA